MIRPVLLAVVLAVLVTGAAGAADGPLLPAGLEKPAGKEMPAGEEMPGPAGGALPFEVSGFWEARIGARTRDDAYQRDMSMGETRLQLGLDRDWDQVSAALTADLLYDGVFADHNVHLDEGAGWLDLREGYLAFSPAGSMDVKLGRQVVTWGTGDLVFINDLFPKDWNSFLIGRDQEYLKAPSDALRLSLYPWAGGLDIVYTPRFDPDRYIDGRRISYWNHSLGRIAGRDVPVEGAVPGGWFSDDELAARISAPAGPWELAAYGYHGFWKSPGGMDPGTGEALFPGLSVWGASARGPFTRGIGNIEIGYYDSEDDSEGDDPFIRNGELRLLAGYEQEVARDLTLGFQYYLERMLDHDAYLQSLPAGGAIAAEEDRSVFTLRITRLMMNQNLVLSLFTYYSPTDEDAYLRVNTLYKVDDSWAVEGGGNFFQGDEDHTFFGQFEGASNLYAGTRYSF